MRKICHWRLPNSKRDIKIHEAYRKVWKACEIFLGSGRDTQQIIFEIHCSSVALLLKHMIARKKLFLKKSNGLLKVITKIA